MTSPSVNALVDHDDIRQWAEQRHAAPGRVMPDADHPDADELTLSSGRTGRVVVWSC